jgi:hypothetical protein
MALASTHMEACGRESGGMMRNAHLHPVVVVDPRGRAGLV